MTRSGLFEDLSDPLNGLFRLNQALLRAPECHRGLSRDMDVTLVVETDSGAAYLRNRSYIKASTANARRNMVGAPMVDVDKAPGKGKKRKGVRFKLTVQFK